MADLSAPSTRRGDTFHGPSKTLADDSSSPYGTSVAMEGYTRSFPDRDPASPIKRRTGKDTVCIFVRNASTVTLLPKMLVSWAAGYRGRRVDGYTDVVYEEAAGVVDEFLGSSGCRQHDLCWIAVKGPSLCITGREAAATNVMNEGNLAYAVVAGASTDSTTAGHVHAWGTTFTGTANTSEQATNAVIALQLAAFNVGRVMSAKTTANTDEDVLVDLNILK